MYFINFTSSSHRYADQVVIGNDILVSGNNEMIPAKVINISYYKTQGRGYLIFYQIMLKTIVYQKMNVSLKGNPFFLLVGAYVPLTKVGNIVVDGVLASCYASCDHDLAHITMAPMQWLPKTIEWLFGEDEGSADLVSIVKTLGRMILPPDSTIGIVY